MDQAYGLADWIVFGPTYVGSLLRAGLFLNIHFVLSVSEFRMNHFLGNLIKIFLFLPRFFPKKSVIIFDLDYIFKDDVGAWAYKLIKNMYIISIYLAQKNSPYDI